MRKLLSYIRQAPRGPAFWVIGVCSLMVVNRLIGLDRLLLAGIQENSLIDKVGHFLFFGLLSFCLHLVVLRKTTWSNGRVVLVSYLAVTVLGTVDEGTQLWFAERTFDSWDLCANVLGVGILGPIALLIPMVKGAKGIAYKSESTFQDKSSAPDRAPASADSRMNTALPRWGMSRKIIHRRRLSRDQRGRQSLDS